MSYSSEILTNKLWANTQWTVWITCHKIHDKVENIYQIWYYDKNCEGVMIGKKPVSYQKQTNK